MSVRGTVTRPHTPLALGMLLVLLLTGLAASVRAQGVGGVIAGTLLDAQGAVLPGVTLTLRNVDTGVVRTAVSESDGGYRLAALPPGRYELKAELAGFAAIEVRNLTITMGVEVRRDLSLTLKGVQESVTVSGAVPVVETTRTEVSGVVTQRQIETLPVSDRQPVTLALLMPGTSSDAIRPRRANANVGAGSTSQAMTAFHVDGGMNWSNNAGEPRFDVPTSAVREFKVNVSQASAEFGGNTGGVVNIITKSGTNRFTGEAFEFFRNKSLNAMNKFEKAAHERGEPKPEYRRHQYGGALGGPVISNRLHFFASGERTAVREYFTVETGQPQFYGALEGTFPRDDTANIAFVRGDLQIRSNQSFFTRFIYMGETNSCEECGGTNAANAGQAVYSPRDSVVFGHTWVMGNRALNEVRIQSPWGAKFLFFTNPPGVPYWKKQGQYPPERWGNATPVYEFPSFIYGSNYWSLNTTQLKEFRDDFTLYLHAKGSHTVKFGGAFLDIPSPEDALGNPLGTWVFGSDQFFDGSPAAIANLRNPIQFTASFPPVPRRLENHWIQGYIQDEWRPLSNVTINLGVRYDNQWNSFNQNIDLSLYPRPLPYIDPKSRGDNNNFGPRAGFAWDLKNDGRSVFRLGYGTYYQYFMQPPLRSEQTALRQITIVIRNPSYPDPYQGQDPYSFASTAPPNIDIVANDLRNPSATTVNGGFSQELKASLALHVDAVYTDMKDMTQRVNINTPDPVTGRRPLPEWRRIAQTGAGGQHRYRALFVRLDKRYSRRHQYLISYTLAKQRNTGSGTNFPVTDAYQPGLDWGPGSADRRHSFVASGSVLLPFDITFGAVWTLRSTTPFNNTAGRDLNNDTYTTDYVPGTTRNMGNRRNDELVQLVNAWRAQNGRKPITADQFDKNTYNRVDMRVNKAFSIGHDRKLELIAQVFNVLGSDNLLPVGGSYVTNALSDSFGRILSAWPRQQAELAARIVF